MLMEPKKRACRSSALGSGMRETQRINEADAASPPMEFPDIEVRGGRIRDCVNVVFKCFTVEEIRALLRKLGWIRAFARHDAHLQGREPVLELQYAIIPEAVRYHIRLFEFNNGVVGNVHFNRLEPDLEKMDLHKSDHEKGLELLMRQLEGRHRVEVVRGRECRILIVDKCF